MRNLNGSNCWYGLHEAVQRGAAQPGQGAAGGVAEQARLDDLQGEGVIALADEGGGGGGELLFPASGQQVERGGALGLRVCGCGHWGLGFQRKRRMAMSAPAAPQAARTARLFQSNPVCWENGPSRAWLNGRTGKAPEMRFSMAE